MRKVILILAALGMGVLALADTPKVPEDIQVRILKIQKDQAQQQNRLLQLQEAYKATSEVISHDDTELRDIRTEALKAANLDAAKYDLDVEKLQFVQKPTNAPPAAAK